MRVLSVVMVLWMASLAQGADLSGIWIGYYVYDAADRTEKVECSMVLEQDHQVVQGKMIEVQTFGTEPSAGLSATLTGTIENRKVHFVKTYDGSGGQTHSVAYKFTLSPNGKTLEGTWTLSPEFTGKAFFKRIDVEHIDDM